MGVTQTKSCVILNSIKKKIGGMNRRKEKRNWVSYNSVISQDWTRGFTISLSLKTSINSLLAAISNTNVQLLRAELQITGVFLLTFLWLFCYYSLSFNYLGDLRWKREKSRAKMWENEHSINWNVRVISGTHQMTDECSRVLWLRLLLVVDWLIAWNWVKFRYYMQFNTTIVHYKLPLLPSLIYLLLSVCN